ncbi:unnamed protein product [Rotaria magnacalcarata]|nr:unnamed protein product [Rotaria magnacalcarata]CAF3950929.1 unnamed protein product [Rotaria magnacalcarata]CAF4101669.1 unnamed protein product [Rotaria magnacalcarata]CAF4259460.1 unnamed protein product [Rotaria magnacalcarata]
MKFNIHATPEEQIPQQLHSQLQQQSKGSTLTHIVRPDLDRLDQMIGKLQRCTTSANTTCVSPIDHETMNRQQQQQQQQQMHATQRSFSSKCRAPLPPPISPPTNNNTSKSGISSSLPGTFISSLRQLFSILDKTNSGYVPFDLFKRYWTPSFSFDNSSSTSDILNELEIESKPNNYLITFDLLLSVIERSLSSTKHSSPPITTSDSSLSSLSTPPIIIPKATRPPPPISFPLNRSTSVVVNTPTPKKVEQQIPVIYRSYNGSENNHYYYSHDNTSIPVRHRKKTFVQKATKQNGNIYSENPLMSTRRNTIHTNDIDFSMIRAMKRFEIERDLLLQTCDTLERVKSYLADRLLEMKDKQRSYCLHLSAAESTGVAPEPLFNRDLVADLLKLASTVIIEANYDSKKSSDRSSSSLSSSSLNGINNQYQQQLKAKDNRIKQLETEKRVLLKELVEMRHQHRTVVPAKNS